MNSSLPMSISDAQLDASDAFFDDNLGFTIGKVHRVLRRQWQQWLEPLEITPPQSASLMLVARFPAISLRDAARYLEIDVMAVRRVLNGLVVKGLVEVTNNSKDSRKFSYTLTPDGAAICQRISALCVLQNQRNKSIIGPRAFAQITTSLSKLTEQAPPGSQEN